MYHDARTDKKLESLSDAEHRVWFHLLCLASDQPEGSRGTIPAMKPRLLAVEVAHGDEALLEAALDKLADLEILAQNDDGLRFLKWHKRQFTSDSSTPRVQRHRAAKAEEAAPSPAPSPGNGHETLPKRPRNGDETAGKQRGNGVVTAGKQDVTPPDPDPDPDPEGSTTTTTTPRTREDESGPARPEDAASSQTEPDPLFEQAVNYVLPLMGRVMLKGTEGPQIQRALTCVNHDWDRFRAVVDELAQRNPRKIRSFAYFVDRFEDELEDHAARAAPRQAPTRPPDRAPPRETSGWEVDPETYAALLSAEERRRAGQGGWT